MANKHYDTEEKLARFFMEHDGDYDDTLDVQEFTEAMDYFHISAEDAEKAFNYLDQNQSGDIAYDEFMLMVQGPMDEDRQNYSDHLFGTLDQNGDGVIDLADLESFYAHERPDVPLEAV